MTYDFWYWPSIPGRGEFVRLAMEAAGVDYRDCAREDGAEALPRDVESREGIVPFAPPYLVAGDFAIAQVAHILAWLADRHGFGAGELEPDLELIQLQLTVTDIVAEVHATHHPVGTNAYYDDQKDAAQRAAKAFRDERTPKYLGYFEHALGINDGPFVLGEKWTHVDTSLFQLIEGLRYAFPRRMRALEGDYPGLRACRDAVAELDGVASYRKSERCIPFNHDGIFRHHEELDGE